MRNFNSYQPPQIQYADDSPSEEEADDFPSDEEDDSQFFSPQQIPNPNYQNGNNNYFYAQTQPEVPENSKRHPKKRKLESFKSSSSNNTTASWTEQDTFLLLETWGEKYLDYGHRSIRYADWKEITERVNDMTGIDREKTEYRNQLEVLKNKYKKEKLKVESGIGTNWMFYKNMDVLLNVRVGGSGLLGCGIDSGEYVFMDSRVYLERGNVLDEMRDSPVESDEEDEEGDEEEEGNEGGNVGGETVRVLVESIKKFGEVYEKIEESKRKQMVEVERMREEFQRDLEVQKKEIVDRAQAEIARIREMGDDEEETDNSVDEIGD